MTDEQKRGRPHVFGPDAPCNKRLCVQVPEALHTQATEVARAQGMAISAWIRAVIIDALAETDEQAG